MNDEEFQGKGMILVRVRKGVEAVDVKSIGFIQEINIKFHRINITKYPYGC